MKVCIKSSILLFIILITIALTNIIFASDLNTSQVMPTPVVKHTEQNAEQDCFSGKDRISSEACVHPEYDNNGKCLLCEAEYEVTEMKMTPAAYKTVKNNVAIKNRPYASEKSIAYYSEGATVTVVAAIENANGDIWYKLKSNVWIHSNDLTKVN